MKYAVIEINKKQYQVSEGDEILVDKINEEKIEGKVLLMVDQAKVKIGKPYVDGLKIKLKVLDKMLKGDKVRVFKYKAKSRYRKTIGFRPQYTKVLVEKIS